MYGCFEDIGRTQTPTWKGFGNSPCRTGRRRGCSIAKEDLDFARKLMERIGPYCPLSRKRLRELMFDLAWNGFPMDRGSKRYLSTWTLGACPHVFAARGKLSAVRRNTFKKGDHA